MNRAEEMDFQSTPLWSLSLASPANLAGIYCFEPAYTFDFCQQQYSRFQTPSNGKALAP